MGAGVVRIGSGAVPAFVAGAKPDRAAYLEADPGPEVPTGAPAGAPTGVPAGGIGVFARDTGVVYYGPKRFEATGATVQRYVERIAPARPGRRSMCSCGWMGTSCWAERAS